MNLSYYITWGTLIYGRVAKTENPKNPVIKPLFDNQKYIFVST